MASCRITWSCPEGVDEPRLDQGRLQRLVDACLADQDLGPCLLTILWVDDAASQALHRTHFNDPSATDVMTFPDGSADPATGLHLLGDLAVNAELATQIGAAHHPASTTPVEDELLLYVVHGLLHLLGHDDIDPTDRQRMWQRQVAVLAAEGITAVDDPA